MPRSDNAIFYQLYFQTPGVAENELERDVRQTFIKTLFSASGDAPYGPWHIMDGGGSVGMVPRDGLLGPIPVPAALPPWLKEADVDFYISEFKRTGFRGGLNWYRNIDRNWELLAPFAGAKITVPALYIAGDRDVVVAFRGSDQFIANWQMRCRDCPERSCSPAAVTGPSRSVPRMSTAQ
jgi:pimeloyl-ACP methyl ester carboxylesterase